MVVIVTRTKGLNKLSSDISYIEKNMHKLTDAVSKKSSELVAGALRQQLSRHRFSGYSSSKRGTMSVKKSPKNYNVITPYYVPFLEHGTIPHFTSSPKAKRWYRSKGGVLSLYESQGSIKISTRKKNVISNAIRVARKRLDDNLSKTVGDYVKSKGRNIR